MTQEDTVKGLGTGTKKSVAKPNKHCMHGWFSQTGQDEFLIKVSFNALSDYASPTPSLFSHHQYLTLLENRDHRSVRSSMWHSCNCLFCVCVSGQFLHTSLSMHIFFLAKRIREFLSYLVSYEWLYSSTVLYSFWQYAKCSIKAFT